MTNFLARLLRFLTCCTMVSDVDYMFDKTRNQYVKVQKRAIQKQTELESEIRRKTERKVRAEKVQKTCEKRIAKLNEFLED